MKAEKIGALAGIHHQEWSEKPKGMHWNTYERLLAEYQKLVTDTYVEMGRWVDTCRMMGRL